MGAAPSELSRDHDLTKKLDLQLDDLRQDIKNRPQGIKHGIIETISSIDDAMVMRYSRLENMSVILENVEKLFQKFPGRERVIETTKKMITDMRSMNPSNLHGWQQQTMFKDHDGKKVGLEIHYKTNMFQDGSVTDTCEDIVVMIAYKCVAHIVDEHDCIDAEEASESLSIKDDNMSLQYSCTVRHGPHKEQASSSI